MRFAVIGTGAIVEKFISAGSQVPGFSLYAVYSRSKERGQAFAAEHGAQRSFDNLADLAACRKVEAVYIASPNYAHCAQALAMLSAGKHVLCEKAFTVNAAQARELFRIAKDKRLLLTEAMWTRYLPMRGTINEVLRSGIVGKPWLLTANLGYMISDVERLKEPSLAGGALLDVGVYPLNFAAMVFGNDPVSIQGSAVLSDKGVDRQDSITLRYADGRMAVLNATMMGMSDRRGVIDCDNGMLEIVNINCPQELRVYNRERVLIASYRAPKFITGYEYEVEACIRALDAGGIECPLMPHAETVRMMEWMDGLRAQFGVRYPEEIEKL